MLTADLAVILLLGSLISCVVVTGEAASAAQRLIDDTHSTDIYHLDLVQRQADASTTAPWFDGFGGGVAAATVGQPIRRMLLHLGKEGIGLQEAMSWLEGEGMYKESRRLFFSNCQPLFLNPPRPLCHREELEFGADNAAESGWSLERRDGHGRILSSRRPTTSRS